MSLYIKSEREFERWRKKARELRARIEDPENAPLIIELLGEMDKLQRKYKRLDKRVRTLESQIQKCYADYITGQARGLVNVAEERTGGPPANVKRRAGVVGSKAEPGLELESMDLELEPIDLELEPIPFEPEDVQK